MVALKLHVEKIDHTAPPEHVARLGLNNKTPLSRAAGKLSFTCPNCYLIFERYACWAKRVNVNYCSRECADEGRKVRVQVSCVVCGVGMELTPSDIGRITTCCKRCSAKRRQCDTPYPRSFTNYKNAVKLIAKREVCSRCGTRSGPWRVRGIESELDDGLLNVDASKAFLLCQTCHFKEVGVIGGRSRQRQRKARGW
jgi:hypothetical protein